MLAAIPAPQANPIIKRLLQTANDLTQIGATRLNDLSGRMFQKLISDRKFLATFYTLPVSTTLLADLAVARLPVDWGDPASVKALRVGDLACGTGTLLGAAYHAIRTRVRRAGCNDEEIHSAMIEQALFASDIMPPFSSQTSGTALNIRSQPQKQRSQSPKFLGIPTMEPSA